MSVKLHDSWYQLALDLGDVAGGRGGATRPQGRSIFRGLGSVMRSVRAALLLPATDARLIGNGRGWHRKWRGDARGREFIRRDPDPTRRSAACPSRGQPATVRRYRSPCRNSHAGRRSAPRASLTQPHRAARLAARPLLCDRMRSAITRSPRDRRLTISQSVRCRSRRKRATKARSAARSATGFIGMFVIDAVLSEIGDQKVGVERRPVSDEAADDGLVVSHDLFLTARVR